MEDYVEPGLKAEKRQGLQIRASEGPVSIDEIISSVM